MPAQMDTRQTQSAHRVAVRSCGWKSRLLTLTMLSRTRVARYSSSIDWHPSIHRLHIFRQYWIPRVLPKSTSTVISKPSTCSGLVGCLAWHPASWCWSIRSGMVKVNYWTGSQFRSFRVRNPDGLSFIRIPPDSFNALGLWQSYGERLLGGGSTPRLAGCVSQPSKSKCPETTSGSWVWAGPCLGFGEEVMVPLNYLGSRYSTG